MKTHGKFCGANFQKQARCAENYYSVVAQKVAEQTENVRKLHCLAQLYANVLVHAS